MAKLICALALAVALTEAFRVEHRRGGAECCCKEKTGTLATLEAKCSAKNHTFVANPEGKSLCCTVKAKGCPSMSHYKKKTMDVCGNKGPTEASVGDEEDEEEENPDVIEDENDGVEDEQPAMALSGKGAYLTWSIQDHGTLTTTWSEDTVEGALAYISTAKDVAKYKFTPQGRSFYKNVGVAGQPAYRQGFAAFAKMGKAFDGSLILSPDADVQLVFLGKDESITIAKPGVPVTLADKDLVVGVHKAVSAFKLRNMQARIFTNKARAANSEAIQM